ncbi:MAG TPA: DUF1015 domain-containing protein [Lachnospiraceae bacterium]|nr:DUF1015 domain-containing protein [Lachnospiraceae bacterium]
MAEIRPFYCVRPTKERAKEVAALPYDVYNKREAREAVKNHPYSFLNIDRPETQFEESIDMYSKQVYEKAGAMLQQWIMDGIFMKEQKKCYYLYELTMTGRTQTGIVACASVEDYENNVIKKHENTRFEKERDRICHVDACNAQTGPIFLACKEDSILEQKMVQWKEQEPIYDFVAEDQVRHRVFLIEKEEEIQFLTEHFKEIPALYIADGHHRAASAVKVSQKRREENGGKKDEEYSYFLSVIFPANQLKILDYNRVVSDLNGNTELEFLEKVQQEFTIQQVKEAFRPEKKGQFGMYLNGQWYQLTVKDSMSSNDVVEKLDVSLLQDRLLNPILGIHDPKTDERIKFVGGIRGLKELERLVDEGDAVAFSMHPTSMEELFQVADAGRLMPPKSTWFEPKLRSGLFIHLLQ